MRDLPQITVKELAPRLEKNDVHVLDVRREGEWEAGHIEGADWYPLDRFKAVLPEVEQNAAHRRSLQGRLSQRDRLQPPARAGYNNIVNVMGGFDAWEKAQLPTAVAAAVGS